MDSPYTGLTASIKLGNKVLCYVSGVDLNIEKDIIEVLALGMQYKEKIPAIKDWSADVDGTCALADGNSQDDLYRAFESGVAVTIDIYLNDTTHFTGSAFVQNFNLSIAPDDKIGLTSSLAGSGALVLTYTDPIEDPAALTVVSIAGTAGHTQPYVNPVLTDGNTYLYKTASEVEMPVLNQALTTGWAAWNGTDEIVSTTGYELVIAEVNATLCKKAGKAIVTAG